MDWCYTLILFCIVMLFPQETQCRSFCDQKRFPIAKVCTDEDVKHIREVYIDTDSVPEFQQTSCECVITPAYQTVPLHLTLYDHSENITSLQFELKDISVGKNKLHNGLNITGATKLLLSAFINHERDGACLAVFSKDGSIFDFSCTASARAAADEEHTESTILVVNICTGNTVTEAHYIPIDTTSVTVFGNISCEYVISPAHDSINLVLNIRNTTRKIDMDF